MTLPTKWKPTKNMRAALTYAQEHGYAYCKIKLCAEIGIDRSTYYGWFHNADFDRWWRNKWVGYFELRLSAIYGTALARAEGISGAKGSTRDAKLLIERFDKGYAPKTRQERTGETTLKTYINVDVPRVAGEKEQETEQGGGDD